MNTGINQHDVSCPICLDTLKNPIRMLSCGHNLCHICLVEYSRNSSESLSCPTCRKVIHLDSQGVENLPRNWMVENMIERLNIHNNAQTPTFKTKNNAELQLTSQELLQLQSLAKHDMQDKRFDDAMHILRRIVRYVEGYHKINHVINLTQCLLETGQVEEAKEFCKDLQLIIHSANFTPAARSVCSNCDVDLRQLAEIFIEKDYEYSILLLRCVLKVIVTLHCGENKLSKFVNTVYSMKKVAEKMSRQNKKKDFENQFPFLEEIVDEMLRETDVDLKVKCHKLAWCFRHVGNCYFEVEYFKESIDAHKQGILLMKSAYGDNAKLYELFGDSYHNLGAAYSRRSQLIEAETAYVQAIQIYETAIDWDNDEKKQSSIRFTENNLKTVVDKRSNS
ncbi:unnamed protein product [Clavelina lepadiformis]|uniref:RING-type domain-containing protein n=1 Tax=Clavelina lepadiformis TaxID=159417 RepID=A0ABP0EVZ5_CLALP